MRRVLATMCAGTIAMTGCTSGDSAPAADAAADDTSATTAPRDLARGESSSDPDRPQGDGAVDPGNADRAPGQERLALPGLLDTSDQPIPDDESVRRGVLDNGLHYYVRFNDNPGGKAELRLAVRAGSVNETGPSTGVAHFAEHMLFNGTERFPENELIDVLRGFGAAFGADINAYTSYDETVYQLTVPNADASIATGLNVLEQWLSHATFDPDQVRAERGVVRDEWRVRTQTTSGRLFQIAEEMYLSGTPYEGRAPIGTEGSIVAMGDAELRGYYDDWYRPDNAAIVVVGEVDVDEIVAEIERLFGPAVPRSAAAPARPDTTFRVDVTPDVSFHVDPDQQTVDVEVTLPIPTGSGSGSAAVRAELVDLLIYDVLVRRLDGDLAAGRAPFDRVTRGGNSFVDALDAPALYAVTDAARARDTLLALLEEYERADRHGFTSDETDLAREAVRSLFDRRFDGRESTQDRDYATRYVNDFLRDEGYPSIEVEHRIATEILDAITPAALDRRFRARWTNSAPHVIISTPEAVAGRLPGEAEVLALIDELPERTIARRDEPRELPEALMERPAPADTNASRRLLDRGGTYFDPEEVSFANGLTLIVNPNPIVEGQVFFLAASPGGSSLVADEDVVDALYAAEVVTSSGVADLNQAELEQVLAGRDVGVGASITPYRESLSGSAATADVEQLLQLVHLYLTRPRFDPVALDQVRRRVGPVVDDPGSDPIVASDDALLDRRYPGELRYARLPEPEEFATLDLEGIERVWTDRFGDASEWVFVVAGDFDPDAVIELAASYLGTLPATGRDEQPVDVEDPPPAGVVRTTIEAGTGDTASVLLSFTSPVDDISARLRATADVVEEVIDARLSDVIREQLGESYSPRAVTRVVTDPDPAIETFLRVTGSPDRVATIADLVVGELGDLAAVGPSDQEFSSAFAHVEEAGGFVNNGEFMTELLDDAIDPARDLDDYLFESTELDRLSAETVRSFIRTHIPVDRFIQVTVLPR